MMDPDTALEAIRDSFDIEDYKTARHAFEALDEWLQQGGFLPSDWDTERR